NRSPSSLLRQRRHDSRVSVCACPCLVCRCPCRPPVPYSTLGRSPYASRSGAGLQVGWPSSRDHSFRLPPNPVETDMAPRRRRVRSEEHTSALQSRFDLVWRLLLEKLKRLGATGGGPARRA